MEKLVEVLANTVRVRVVSLGHCQMYSELFVVSVAACTHETQSPSVCLHVLLEIAAPLGRNPLVQKRTPAFKRTDSASVQSGHARLQLHLAQ